MLLSIIIPVLNEAACIVQTLRPLQSYRGDTVEVIIVDGGSNDLTIELARPLADVVLSFERGRAKQMNFGARQACGDYLLFLHADTILPGNAFSTLKKVVSQPRVWGHFDVKLSGEQPLLRMVESLMNWRSRLSGIATGDQALFVSDETFKLVGGFPEIALMEDIALSKKLTRIAKPICLKEAVISSSRRWETNGILRTILLMWSLRLQYFLGVDPHHLAKKYS